MCSSDLFRWQYCWMLLCLLVIGLWQRQRWSLVWLLPLTLNSVLIFSLAWPPGIFQQPGSTEPSLTILHANIDHKNLQPSQAIEYVNNPVADIVFLQEITPTTLPLIVDQLKNYRLVAAEPKTNSHCSAMFVPLHSSLEIIQKQIVQVPNYSHRPLLTVDVRLGKAVLSLMSVHITRPGTPRASKFQAIEFQSVADWGSRQMDAGKSVVIIGDFNNSWLTVGSKILFSSDPLSASTQLVEMMTADILVPQELQKLSKCCYPKADENIFK